MLQFTQLFCCPNCFFIRFSHKLPFALIRIRFVEIYIFHKKFNCVCFFIIIFTQQIDLISKITLLVKKIAVQRVFICTKSQTFFFQKVWQPFLHVYLYVQVFIRSTKQATEQNQSRCSKRLSFGLGLWQALFCQQVQNHLQCPLREQDLPSILGCI